MATEVSHSFTLDAGIFTTTNLTLAASTDANALEAVATNSKFPDGDITLGHISLAVDTGQVSLNPASVGGASVSFDLSASAQSGIGVYGSVSSAIQALSLANPPSFTIPNQAGQRYLLLDAGYSVGATGSGTIPVGMLGSATFGVDAKQDALLALVHRFDPNESADNVLQDAFSSLRLPRHVAFDGHDVNIQPGTWLIVEADGSLAFTLTTSLGWNVSYAKDLKLLDVSHNLSARIDASIAANLGFNVSGKYLLAVGREDTSDNIRLQLWKQATKNLNFGFNINVGIQGADPQLPTDLGDFIKSIFGVHGLQVLNDLKMWTDPTQDLGKQIAGLADQTALDLLKSTTGIDPATEFNKAKQIVTNALTTWTNLPTKTSSMLWTYLEKLAGNEVPDDFKTTLTDLANPAAGADALAKILQNATFGDTPEGQFLESIADKGLLALSNEIAPVSKVAGQVLDILNGGLIARLQAFINQKLDLAQITAAVNAASFDKIDQWLQNRLANFLDKALDLAALKDIQTAIHSLETKAESIYATTVQALTKRYSIEFATVYQSCTTDTALLDVNFDLSNADASQLYNEVMCGSGLDLLLTKATAGVTLNQGTLTHEIKRNSSVDLHMPFFDFTSTSVNDTIVTLTAEDQGGRVLLYQVTSSDTETVANRMMSQLSILASLTVDASGQPQLDTEGSIAYEMLQAKAAMRPADMEARTEAFIHNYLAGLFSGGDASIRGFYTDLDIALTAATRTQSNLLGDVALSMQLSLPANLLSGWLAPRTTSLVPDQMTLSRSLQAAWRSILPTLYLQDLGQYQRNEAIAALLVWSSLPVSTGIDVSGSTLTFNNDKQTFWDWPNVDLRRAIAADPHTIATLGAKLSAIQAELTAAGNSNASSFAPSMAGQFVQLALNSTGDTLFQSLLFTEAEMIDGATDALKNAAGSLKTAATAPTQAIRLLATFASSLTDTFNKRVNSVYSGVSGRVVGPMLFVEASAALGSAGTKPSALMNLYALNQGHTFDLATFITGSLPARAQVALTQTLVGLQ